MTNYEILVDFFKDAYRQGPGGIDQILRILEILNLDFHKKYTIADIGCGTGVSSLVLAENIKGEITSIDIFPEFLEILDKKASQKPLMAKINTLNCSMDNLPFENEMFDIIWSEGAIYNIGFEKGIVSWKPYVKKGGFLVVSEVSWITETRPKEIEDYWKTEYGEIDTVSNKLNILKKNGYKIIDTFVLPENCWKENFYDHVVKLYDDFLERHAYSTEAIDLVQEMKKEIEIYDKYKQYFSYGFYIVQK